METVLTLNLNWLNAVLGIILGAFSLAAMVGMILRLWLQPLVGKWIELAIERDRKWVAEQIELLRQQLRDCQGGRQARMGDLRHEVERIENTLAEDVREIRQAVRELSSLVPEMAGVKAELSALREQLRGLAAARQP